ncbi:immunity 42 family protein [Pseudomonas sp. COW5]|uniref:immunity 42 family protein n=1 Tax=Pseudomonas sp. COW5 TaxID=2981253 RepID=UPI002247FFD1|nr:immunity 42 family protein [Pseudomonas sp. COW5]MCX2545954.1 immunity 42 family protein [Pseudomonas sp. COW5]
MIFGEPTKFAILMDCVTPWNVEGSCQNGIFHYIINSNFFPGAAQVATLGGDVHCLQTENALTNPVEDLSIFNMDSKKAFILMLEKMLPEKLGGEVQDGFVEDYRFNAGTYNLEGFECFVFAVACGSKVRLLAADLSCISYEGDEVLGIDAITISEVVLERSWVAGVVKNVIDKYESDKMV